MLEFNNCPYRNAPYMGPHSQWIVDIYQKYFGDKTDGFLVEIGVGCVLDWNLMGTPRMLDWEKDEIIRGESHTLELLENGWTGIYIESIHEIMDNEFEPLIKKILPEEQVEKIKIVKCGASDKRRVTRIFSQESLEVLPDNETEVDTIVPYNYQGRKLLCDATSTLLDQNDCPYDIDFLLMDVEGHEISAIAGLDFTKHRPKLMLIETGIVPVQEVQKALPDDYKLIGMDSINSMFVHKDFYIE